MEDQRGILRLLVWMLALVAALVLILLIVGCAPKIDTRVDNRCSDSRDNQYACWRAQEAVGPR